MCSEACTGCRLLQQLIRIKRMYEVNIQQHSLCVWWYLMLACSRSSDLLEEFYLQAGVKDPAALSP